jgi:hypothetical protein
MKKLLAFLILPACIFFYSSCGSGNDTQQEESTEEIVEDESVHTIDMSNTTKLDLNDYGYPIILNIPGGDEMSPEPIIDELDWGALEIRIGTNFQIQVTTGDGDAEQKKADIVNLQDIPYDFEYSVDDSDALLYSAKIAGTEMEPEFHFYFVVKEGAQIFEIEDIKGEGFDSLSVERMFDLATTTVIKGAN